MQARIHAKLKNGALRSKVAGSTESLNLVQADEASGSRRAGVLANGVNRLAKAKESNLLAQARRLFC